jgi:hypothetical protein
MDVLGFATLVVVGFTSCAEFGSYALVYPVIRRLPAEHYLTVEKGLLHTLGRAMPPLFIGSTALAIANASVSGGAGGPALWRWLGAGFLIAALVSTSNRERPDQHRHRKMGPATAPCRLEIRPSSVERFQCGTLLVIADRIRPHLRRILDPLTGVSSLICIREPRPSTGHNVAACRSAAALGWWAQSAAWRR